MRRARELLMASVCTGLCLLAFGSAPASASDAGACTISQAKAHVATAQQNLENAQRRLARAQRILDETRTYTALYGAAVGRWVRLAHLHYSRAELATVMLAVNVESRGRPDAANGDYRGLMQVGSEWANGSKSWYWDQWGLAALWNRYDVHQTFEHTTHMAWSNWPWL